MALAPALDDSPARSVLFARSADLWPSVRSRMRGEPEADLGSWTSLVRAYPREGMKRSKAELGQDAVAAYKTLKGALQIGGGVVLAILFALGLSRSVESFAQSVTRHASAAWSVHLASAILAGATPRHLELAIGALFADGILSSIEGWSLRRRKWWGPWLVVVATSSLVP